MGTASAEVIDCDHLYLFAMLMSRGRVSIHDSNPQIRQWNALKNVGLCSILESGRSGTLVIH